MAKMKSVMSENEKKIQIPIDRGWAWLIVVGQFVNVFIMVGLAKSMGIFMESFKKHFNVSTAFASMVMAAAAIVYAFVGPFCLLLGEHCGIRPIIMFGGLVGCIGISLSSFLVSMEFVIIFFGIGFGIGNSTVYGNGLVMLGQYFVKRRTLANGLALAGSSIGQFALPPIIQILLDNFGLNGTVLLIGGLYFHITLFASLFRPMSYYTERQERYEVAQKKMEMLLQENGQVVSDSDEDILESRETDNFEAGHSENMDHSTKYKAYMASTGSLCLAPVETEHTEQTDRVEEPVKKKSFLRKMFDFSILRNYICIYNIVFGFFSFFGYFNFVLFLPPHVISLGVLKYEMTWLVSACGMGDLCGRIFLGFIGDMQFIQRYKLEMISLMCVGVNTLFFAFADTFWWMMIHSVFYGLFGGGYVCMTAVVLIDMIGLELMPKMLALLLLMQGIGAALGQPLLGWIYDLTGSYQVVMFICGSSCIVGAFILGCWPIVKRWEARRRDALNKSTEYSHELFVN